ncbi:MAG: amidohydrolase family protein [Acidobacteriota bacterium]|jgi:imidazolonepropionase-like amidohydrolase/Tol biopolymer transport system component
MTTDLRFTPALLALLLLLAPGGVPGSTPALAAPAGGHHHPDALAPELHGGPGVPPATPQDQGESEGMTENGTEGDGAEESDAWNVDEPHGPTSTVEIDTTSGTWMSLDVSPDGTEIVFDLLGDLYTVPIDGGDATPLTHGLAWDMQPTYSPDGSKIAFTSDRGGGDNLWILSPSDGGDDAGPHQVTDESFRLLNSPAWTPDGEFLVGRKHYTGTRSLGAGEIWLYHRSGGSGLQLTERPNEQKDVGEPAVSPDGRFVYYSRDTTPGPIFEYNKDPNAGIYSIFRLDRETGETERLISGPGGAIRPTPSPDGESLAFVRRVREKTVLWVRDLASGAERPLFDGLDRDMQETWAIHGVYPAMAWTPDSESIVLWAGGGIHRVDAATGEATEIPFRVRATKTLVEPVRFPVDVAPERFDVKMIRWARVAPAGDRVAFQALGRIWIKDLPDGEPRPLTAQDDHFELYPSWSRDGERLVYVTWDDRELGSVRVASITGGTSGTAGAGKSARTLTTEPGHYVEPAFGPDGETVVYRKIDGGWLRSPLYSNEPGIYRVDLGTSGAPERIVDRGADPHFGAPSEEGAERVYLTRRSNGTTELFSVALDGSDERVHATSGNAVFFRVSPDGRWLGWQERFDAHVTPFPATGKPVAVGPGDGALPVTTVSRDAGNWLHWSGASDALHWTTGPELFTRRLPEAFAFLDGAPEELPEPPSEGIDLGFSAPTAAPSGVTALVGGRIITMRGDEVIEDGAIVIEGDRIRAAGPRDEVRIPGGARVIDTSGKTLMPGLVDVHWHGGHGNDGIIPQQNWNYYATLAFGVTTVHDPSAGTATVFSSAEMARAGLITAPRVFSTGTILYGAETPFRAVIEDLEDARSHLRRMKAAGAISVKSYNQPRRDQRQQVLQAARELGMMVVPEGGSLFQHNMTMVVDGHTGIEHSIPVASVYDDVRQLWAAASGVGYTPTLVVGYGGLWGENYWYAKTKVWEDERLLSFVPREVIDARSRRRVTAPDGEWNHFENARVAAELHDEGVPVLLGAHGQREGLGAHWELWMLGQGGMSAHDALRAATLDGAWYLGMDGDLGSIEPGKLADVLVLSENPLDDLRASRTVETVVLGGRVYDAATLDQVAPEERPREPFFWERGDDGRLLVNPAGGGGE